MSLRQVALLVLFSFSLHPTVFGSALIPELLGSLGQVREYFSSNPNHRFLIKVHLWGNTPLSGIHHLPDNATLLDLLGSAGGPTGVLDLSSISINRRQKGGKGAYSLHPIEIKGPEFFSRNDSVLTPLSDGDVIYLNSPPKEDTFMRNLAMISLIVGIVSTSFTVYLLTKK